MSPDATARNRRSVAATSFCIRRVARAAACRGYRLRSKKGPRCDRVLLSSRAMGAHRTSRKTYAVHVPSRPNPPIKINQLHSSHEFDHTQSDMRNVVLGASILLHINKCVVPEGNEFVCIPSERASERRFSEQQEPQDHMTHKEIFVCVFVASLAIGTVFSI